jgi:hypothetical protein
VRGLPCVLGLWIEVSGGGVVSVPAPSSACKKQLSVDI